MSHRADSHPLQIAIDGFVASGKSAVGAMIAQRLGMLYLDTGIMYRTVALLALESNTNPSDEGACARIAETMDLHISLPSPPDGRQNTVLVGGRDVTWEIRSEIISHIVPQISSHQVVRDLLIKQQRHIGDKQSVVMVGRDIASVVLPQAQLKVRLIAPLDVRVRRRAKDLIKHQHTRSVDLTHLRREIERRDELDEIHMSRAPDIVVVNTESLTVAEVVEHIVQLVPKSAG